MGPQEGHATAVGTGVLAQLYGPGSGRHALHGGARDKRGNPNRDCHWVGLPDPDCDWCPSTAFDQLCRLGECMDGHSQILERCAPCNFQILEQPGSHNPNAVLVLEASSRKLWQSQVQGPFLDVLHHHPPVWQAFPLWRLDMGRGLQPTEEAGGYPAESSAGEVSHATVRGGAATITQCAGLVLWECAIFLLLRVLLDRNTLKR